MKIQMFADERADEVITVIVAGVFAKSQRLTGALTRFFEIVGTQLVEERVGCTLIDEQFMMTWR